MGLAVECRHLARVCQGLDMLPICYGKSLVVVKMLVIDVVYSGVA